MTLEQLRALCAVVDHGGFHAAAQSLFRSQSSISMAIKKLEQELNLTLFDRTIYRPALTDQGQIVYAKARNILTRTEELAHIARHFSQGEETEIALALSAIAPVEQVLAVIRRVSDAAPATRMRVQIENMTGTLERLQDKEVDLAIAEQCFPEPQLEQVRLTSTEMIPVISPAFPLAVQYPHICLSDLDQYVQVVVRDTSRKQAGASAGVLEGAPQWLVNDFDMKKRMILSGAGWGRMPRHRIAKALHEGRLLALSGPGLGSIHIDMYLFRRPGEAMGPVGEQLWQLLQRCQYLPAP